MARIRSIKPEFWDSPSTAEASPWARLLYIAMWNWADDWGVGDAHPGRLLSFAFPHDDNEFVQTRNFRHLVAEMSKCFGVVFYEVGGRSYYSIPSWEQHQRTEKRANRKNPPPPDDVLAGQSDSVQKVSENPSPSGGSSEGGNRKKEIGRSTLSDSSDDRFDDFWDTYDKKVGRKTTQAKYRAALKKPGVTANLLISAAAAYIKNQQNTGKHPEYTKNPTTWLNGEHWTDEATSSSAEPKRMTAAELEEPPDGLTPDEYRRWRDERRVG